MDDLYNNLKVYEPEVKRTSSSNTSTQNMAFVSSNNSGNTNEAVKTAHGVSAISTQVSAANSTNVDNLSDAVICSDQAEERPTNYALMAYSSSSSDSAVSNDSTCSKSCLETVEVLKSQCEQLLKRFEKFELMVVDYKTCLQFLEERIEFYKKNESVYVEKINGLKWDIQVREITIRELRKKLEIIVDNYKKGLGYNAVPHPLTGNFMPPKPDLSFTSLEEFTNELVVIKPAVSDSEEENVSQTKIEKKTAKPSFVKIDFVKAKQTNKTDRKTAKQVEHNRQNTHILRGNQRNWNNMMSQRLGSNFEMFNKACYVCGSFDHLQVDCNYQRVVKPVWNNAKRVNHHNFAKKTHPYPKKNMVPRAVLMKSGLVLVNIAHSKTTVNAARPKSHFSKIAHSIFKRPIHKKIAFKNSNFNQRINTVKDKNVNAARPKAVVNAARPKAVVNVVKRNNVNAVKASTCWVCVTIRKF
ncbi:hypothetical protein Tco_0317342 [Tanacetum coccineum]